MITLSDFQRRLSSDGKTTQVDLTAGRAMWLPAQTHSGHTIGDTETHVIFVELKTASAVGPAAVEENLGPTIATWPAEFPLRRWLPRPRRTPWRGRPGERGAV